jgi:hypothetical protein
MSHVEVAEIFGRVLKRDVRAEKEEIGNGRLRAERSEHDEYGIENLVKMFEYYDQFGLVGNPNVLRWLLMREPASLNAFVERILNERDEIN